MHNPFFIFFGDFNSHFATIIAIIASVYGLCLWFMFDIISLQYSTNLLFHLIKLFGNQDTNFIHLLHCTLVELFSNIQSPDKYLSLLQTENTHCYMCTELWYLKGTFHSDKILVLCYKLLFHFSNCAEHMYLWWKDVLRD